MRSKGRLRFLCFVFALGVLLLSVYSIWRKKTLVRANEKDAEAKATNDPKRRDSRIVRMSNEEVEVRSEQSVSIFIHDYRSMNYIYDNSPQRWEETATSACTNTLLLRGLTIKCRMSHKEEEKVKADGILLNRFVPLRYRDQLKRYHDGQVLFVLNMEGEKEKEWSDPQLTNMWDFKIGYRLDSDLPLLYGCGDFDGIDIVGSLLRKYDAGEIVPPKHRTGLVAMISNCQKVANSRLAVLKAFMNASKVDVFSYGHCENNMKTQQTRFNNPNWHSMKLEIFQQHKFGMAYESKNIDQYVTEKIYSCLATGVIPIYHGASDVHLFVPKGSYIDASKFGSVQELIAHVEKVDNDPQLYASYFQWDVTNLRLLHRNYCYAPVHCRWCERVAQIRDNNKPKNV